MIRFAALALACAATYALLGAAVSHVPPSGLDAAGAALTGGWPRLALIFTESCWWEMLAALGIIGIGAAIRFPAWRARIVTSIITTLVLWQLSDALKRVFGRPRPPYWRLIHETSLSYSSGHAMFATVVFGLWAYFVWNSALPGRARALISPLLLLWALGILWSRLALGAHYVTDLAGGVLLGLAGLAAGAAVRAALARPTAAR